MISRTRRLTKLSQAVSQALRITGWAIPTVLLLSKAAWANLGASPLVVEVQSDRGQAQAIINVINSGNTPIRARIYTEPFTYDRETGFKTLASEPHYLGSYLQFSPKELVVPPGVSRRVRMIARLAPSLPEGEYRAVIFTESLNETQNINGRKVGLVTRVGTTVYVRKGKVSPNLVVDSAQFDAAQSQVRLLVRNTGDASVRPGITWSLKQGDKTIKTGELPPSAVVAQSDRNFRLLDGIKEQLSLSPGSYQLTGRLNWGEDEDNHTLPFKTTLIIPAASTAANSQ